MRQLRWPCKHLGMDFKEMVTALNTLEPERMKTSSGFSEDEIGWSGAWIKLKKVQFQKI